MTPVQTRRRSRPIRHQLSRAVGAAVQALEARRLMSLTVSLRDAATGADSAVVTAGQVLTLDVVATVTAPDGTTVNDAVQDVEGSFLSAAAAASPVAGNLSVANTAPFNGLGSEPGTVVDLNGDGNLDVGSNDTAAADSQIGGYFFARSGDSPETAPAGTTAGDSVSFVIATATYTVTAVNGGGETNLNFRPRDTSADDQGQGTIAARWGETPPDSSGSETLTDEYDGTFAAGSPFHVYGSAGIENDTGTVTATAYADANGDGSEDDGEGPVSGARVYVDLGGTGTYASTDPSAVTGTDGTATIDGVPAGAYTVRVVAPTGYTQRQPAAAGGYPVTVTAGATAAAGPFGAEPDGSISGSVYIDSNGDGTQQATETGVPSAAATTTAYLDLNGNGVLDAGDVSTSVINGTFSFVTISPGTYTLRVASTTGDAVTQPSGGGQLVTVAPAQAVTGETFGLAPVGAVTGTVFGDANGNGVQDGTDAGLAGVTVYVDANDDGVLDDGEPSAVSDATGAYTIAGVVSGTYHVRAVGPTGDAQTAPATGVQTVAVDGGGTATAVAIAFKVAATPTPTPTGTGTISGTVRTDPNAGDTGDGARAGVTVYLDDNGNGRFDAGEPVVVTGADGTYTFAGLPVGTYTVRELVALGTETSSPPSGSYGLTVTAGGTDSGTDFGVTPLAAAPLAAAFVAGPKATATGGDVGTAKVRVTNPSTTATFAGPVTLSLYPSLGGTVYTQDAPAGAVTKTLRLRPRQSAVVTVKYTLPLTLATGTYTFVAAAATAAATGTSPTVAPALASAAPTVAVSAATVDFAAAIVAPAAGVAVRPAKRATVAVRLTNAGTYVANGTVTVTVYSTTTGAVDAAAVAVGTVTARRVKVARGKSVVIGVPITAPSAAAGSYQLVAVVTSSTTPADADAANDTSAAVATR